MKYAAVVWWSLKLSYCVTGAWRSLGVQVKSGRFITNNAARFAIEASVGIRFEAVGRCVNGCQLSHLRRTIRRPPDEQTRPLAGSAVVHHEQGENDKG